MYIISRNELFCRPTCKKCRKTGGASIETVFAAAFLLLLLLFCFHCCSFLLTPTARLTVQNSRTHQRPPCQPTLPLSYAGSTFRRRQHPISPANRRRRLYHFHGQVLVPGGGCRNARFLSIGSAKGTNHSRSYLCPVQNSKRAFQESSGSRSLYGQQLLQRLYHRSRGTKKLG